MLPAPIKPNWTLAVLAIAWRRDVDVVEVLPESEVAMFREIAGNRSIGCDRAVPA